LIKHLLVADPRKRFGSNDRGVDNIYNHRIFKDINWKMLFESKIIPEYIPKIKSFVINLET
jgi:hypothetical protein